MELWDAYDADFNKIEGITLIRDQPIPDGCCHLLCDFMVKHRDGSYLLMKRDERKHFGGKWELSGGGSAIQGEDPLTAVKRELKEETGITAEEITELGRNSCPERHYISVEYLVVTGMQKDAVTLQEGETVDYRWVERDTVLEMYEKGEQISRRMMKLVNEKGL